VVFRKEIVVTVRRRDGRVETRRVVVDGKVGGDRDGDLVTLWAFRLISCLFAQVTRGGSASFSFVDLGGASRTQVCIWTGSTDFLGSGCADRTPYIGFGSSTIPPVRTDYVLRSELARVRGSRVVDESAFILAIAGSWTPDSDVTVCEVGLYMLVCDSGSVARYVLFDRSVLSPCISVIAGSTISVSYVFRF
jgi:hypothetical protein